MSDSVGGPEHHPSDSAVDGVAAPPNPTSNGDRNSDAPLENQVPESANTDPESCLGKGLSSMLSSIIRDFDTRAEATSQSQDQLLFQLDRLTRELDRLLEVAPLPFIMQHAAKISGVRKRISSLNSVLKSIQRRIDNIDRIISAGLMREKMSHGDVGQI